MTRLFKIPGFFKILCAILLLAAPAIAHAEDKAAAEPAKLEKTPQPTMKKIDKKDWGPDIENVQTYLNGLKSGRARFVQTTHDGTQLVGTFYLQRPGKLRFEYDPPIEDFVVADGVFIYFYDAELKEQTNAPIGQTLADFFLRPELHLDGDITVENVSHGGGMLQMEVVQTNDPTAGSLTLGFTEDPLSLKKWRITDAQGLITEVELFYLKTDITHPADLFAYHDPNPKPLNR